MEEFTKYLSAYMAPIWIIVILFSIYIVEQAIKVIVDWKTYKRQVVFSKLHERRAIIIGEMYQKIIIFYSYLQQFTRIGHLNVKEDSEEELIKSLANDLDKSYVDAKNYFELNRIYIPVLLCDKISNMLSKMSYSAIDYSFLDKDIRESVKGRYIESLDEKLERCSSIRDQVDGEFLNLIDELEIESRNLLGTKMKKNRLQKNNKEKI